MFLTDTEKVKIVEEIKSFLNGLNEDSEYDYYGIRTQKQEFQLGEIEHKSSIWIDGDETEEQLDGICTWLLYDRFYDERHNDIENALVYQGEHIAIIASNYADGGEDTNEMIMRPVYRKGNGPYVVKVIR